MSAIPVMQRIVHRWQDFFATPYTNAVKESEDNLTHFENRIYQVTRFAGNLQEYERWKGYECDILDAHVDLGKIRYDADNLKKLKSLLERGMEAIVNYQVSDRGTNGDRYEIGLPVRPRNSVQAVAERIEQAASILPPANSGRYVPRETSRD